MCPAFGRLCEHFPRLTHHPTTTGCTAGAHVHPTGDFAILMVWPWPTKRQDRLRMAHLCSSNSQCKSKLNVHSRSHILSYINAVCICIVVIRLRLCDSVSKCANYKCSIFGGADSEAFFLICSFATEPFRKKNPNPEMRSEVPDLCCDTRRASQFFRC